MLLSHVALGLVVPPVRRAVSIQLKVDLTAFVVTDGEAWQDQGFFALYSDPNMVLELPPGYALGSYAVTLMQEGRDATGGPVVVPATTQIMAGDLLSLHITATATHPGNGELTLERVVEGLGVHVPPAATPGVYEVDLKQGEGALVVPWDALFEPSISGREIGTLEGEASDLPDGVVILADGMQFDPAVLTLQTDTNIAIIATNDNPLPSDPKAISLSVRVNEVTMTGPLTLAQGYVGGDLLELIDLDAMLDLGHWQGSATTDYVTVRVLEDGTLIDHQVEAVFLKPGSEYQVQACLWAQGTGPSQGGSARLMVLSNVMTVLDWLSVSDTNGDGSQWNLVIDGIGDGGPPDAMVVRGLVIDGREGDAGLTVGDLRAATTDLVVTHTASAPTYDLEGEMQVFEPVIVGPDMAVVTRQTDILRDGVAIEMDAGATRPLLTTDDGTSIAVRTTYTAPDAANAPLVSLSPATPVTLGPPPARIFTSSGLNHPEFDVSGPFSALTMGGWFDRPPGDRQLYQINEGYVTVQPDGGAAFFVRDSANNGVLAGTIGDVTRADGALTHIVFQVDLTDPATPLFRAYRDGSELTPTYSLQTPSSGMMQPGRAALLAGYNSQFRDVFFDQGTSINLPSAHAVFDAAALGADVVIGGASQRALPVGAPQTPNINIGAHNGTRSNISFATDVTSGNEPFSEVA